MANIISFNRFARKKSLKEELSFGEGEVEWLEESNSHHSLQHGVPNHSGSSAHQTEPANSFAALADRNAANAERIKQERMRANKDLLLRLSQDSKKKK